MKYHQHRYFTYTNCDDEAYVDFYFKNKYDESEQPLQLSYEHDQSGSQEYGDYSHCRLEFLPGFEPECGCDIVSVTSNVLKADSIEDITDPYVSGIIGEGDRRSGFQSFEYGRLEYTTHFEDACGVCWSLVNFSGYETITDEYTSNYYLVPICATPVEFDTICYYDKYLPDQEFPGGATGELSEYINDGQYDYQSFYYPSEGGYDYYSIYIDVDITFIEFMGNSLLAFGFDQFVESYYQGDYAYGYNYATLLVDVPDTMGYDSAYIDNFILCSEAYFEFFWGYIVKNAGDILDDVRADNTLSDENALNLAKLVLSTYAENVDSPACPLSEGVLEDTANNVYGLQYTGGVITTSLFNAAPFNIEDVYLTNVLLAPAGEAGITKVDLEICYCNDSIFTRFEEFQAATGCDSDYTDPRTYIDDYVNAHFVEDGDHRYLEINYAVPVYDVCNGYSEGTYETFRVCVDEEISIDKMCINAEELFYNFYNYGFVNFGDLLYEGDSVYFENEEGDCYTIGYGYGDDDDDDDESDESYVNCEYELQSCECNESIYNGKSINDVDNVDVYSNSINLQVNANDYTQYYYLNFYFIHDESGSKVQIEYFYSGEGGSSSYDQLFEITGADLDCCCKLESFVVDENDLYTYVSSYIAKNEGQYLSLDDFIYYFKQRR